MRCRGPIGIHHAACAKGPARRRHKARRCERPAQAGDAAVGARRIQPGRIDGKLPGRATASSPAQQTHTIGAHARPGARARGDNAPTAANGKTVRDHAGRPRIRDAGAVGPRVNLAAVHRERPDT